MELCSVGFKKIYYPGLTTHPVHKIAKKQMTGFGGMFSFEIAGDLEDTIKFLESLQLIALAEREQNASRGPTRRVSQLLDRVERTFYRVLAQEVAEWNEKHPDPDFPKT